MKIEEYFLNWESTGDIQSSVNHTAPRIGVFIEDDIHMYQISNMEKAHYNEIMQFNNWETAINNEIAEI